MKKNETKEARSVAENYILESEPLEIWTQDWHQNWTFNYIRTSTESVTFLHDP